MHKLQGSLFLCKLYKIPDGVMPDEHVMLCGRLSFALEEDSDFNSRDPATLAVISNMLSQTQIDRIIESVILKIQQLRALRKSKQNDYF